MNIHDNIQPENSYFPIGFLRHFSLLPNFLRNFLADLLPQSCVFNTMSLNRSILHHLFGVFDNVLSNSLRIKPNCKKIMWEDDRHSVMDEGDIC